MTGACISNREESIVSIYLCLCFMFYKYTNTYVWHMLESEYILVYRNVHFFGRFVYYTAILILALFLFVSKILIYTPHPLFVYDGLTAYWHNIIYI